MKNIYIGIGSNLDNPVNQVSQAISELQEIAGVQKYLSSSLYRSVPIGPADQPDYINAVAGFELEITAHKLLDLLQSIELRHKRIRTDQRWGPRTLDLDLLLFGDEIIADSRLTVPHPGLDQRNFVLYPLYEISPNLNVAGHGPISELIQRCDDAGLERLSET